MTAPERDASKRESGGVMSRPAGSGRERDQLFAEHVPPPSATEHRARRDELRAATKAPTANNPPLSIIRRRVRATSIIFFSLRPPCAVVSVLPSCPGQRLRRHPPLASQRDVLTTHSRGPACTRLEDSLIRREAFPLQDGRHSKDGARATRQGLPGACPSWPGLRLRSSLLEAWCVDGL